jgi:hypothetical protein
MSPSDCTGPYFGRTTRHCFKIIDLKGRAATKVKAAVCLRGMEFTAAELRGLP